MKLERTSDNYVINELIEFLNEKMDSENKLENRFVDINHEFSHNVHKLFDDDQVLHGCSTHDVKGPYFNSIDVVLLENNRLLTIVQSDSYDDSYCYFGLYKNGEDMFVKTENNGIGNILRLMNRSNGTNSGNAYYIYPENRVIKKACVKDILRPVTMEQIIERSKEYSK